MQTIALHVTSFLKQLCFLKRNSKKALLKGDFK